MKKKNIFFSLYQFSFSSLNCAQCFITFLYSQSDLLLLRRPHGDWRGPGSRFEPGTGGFTGRNTNYQTTTPPFFVQFLSINSTICRPSDRTVERPRAKIRRKSTHHFFVFNSLNLYFQNQDLFQIKIFFPVKVLFCYFVQIKK